ncbi:hypothetical protein GEMRC1_012337 [Eukaryota sp. GEM-RC1]
MSSSMYSSMSSPRIRLHFDLNKTIILSDIASNKSVGDVVNHLIAESAYGLVSPCGKYWNCTYNDLSLSNPCKENPAVCSYTYFIANFLLPFPSATSDLEVNRKMFQDIRDIRNQHFCSFTDDGNPGTQFREIYESVMGKILENNTTFELSETVPSFWNFIKKLKYSKSNILLTFRTFGKDLEKFLPMFNSYCDSIGAENLKISKTAVFFRCNTNVLLAVGSMEALPLTFSFEDAVKYYENQNCRILIGFQNIHNFLNSESHLAIRDHYYYWAAHGESNNSGKILFLPNISKNDDLEIFLDDHIRVRVLDKSIVDVRHSDGSEGCKFKAFEYGHLLRVNALFGFLNNEYFEEILVNALDQLRKRYDLSVDLKF